MNYAPPLDRKTHGLQKNVFYLPNSSPGVARCVCGHTTTATHKEKYTRHIDSIAVTRKTQQVFCKHRQFCVRLWMIDGSATTKRRCLLATT